MAIEPIPTAELIYNEALGSLMAHTIRGVVNRFRKYNISLEILVMPDSYGRIQLHGPTHGTTSVMVTNFLARPTKTECDRLSARIYIHQHANKHLARVCIAHEIYHLLTELDEFMTINTRTAWPVIASSRALEDGCNHFAWQLCKMHDQFNRDINHRQNHIHFPEHTFDQPFNMNDSTEWITRWPDGFSLDPQHPFYK